MLPIRNFGYLPVSGTRPVGTAEQDLAAAEPGLHHRRPVRPAAQPCPPSTLITWPVIRLACADSRKLTRSATSLVDDVPPSGVLLS
jgi:hypothetical protein